MKDKLKEKTNIRKKIFIIIIYMILIFLLIYSGIKIVKWKTENVKTQEIIEQIKVSTIPEHSEVDTKPKIDFESLLKQNKNVVAWLKVNGTNIEYPIVKAQNNEYYLYHSFDNSYTLAGWPFADYKNKFDGTDKNIVIYGHNRKDGSMFGTLNNILTSEWQENAENYTLEFYTPGADKEYAVFSVYKVPNEDYYIKTDFGNGEYAKFIETIKNRSIKNFGVEVNESDNILTLSTCGETDRSRVVLHAKEIK